MTNVVIDMMGHKVEVDFPPKRIVSIVPSQTELLYDLGLDDEVVGITKFCIHPQQWYRTKTRVGGTKNLHIEKIKSLRPDLIIANKEENTRQQIEELQRHFPVWISDIAHVDEALQMISDVGILVNKETAARQIIHTVKSNFPNEKIMNRRAAYFIWYRPWMSVGKDTFIHDVLRRCGYENVFGHEMRYPEVSAESLREADPDIVFLSSEPFPFKEKHLAEVKNILPNAEVRLVDGEMFSWYGSRMVKACDYLKPFLQTRS